MKEFKGKASKGEKIAIVIAIILLLANVIGYSYIVFRVVSQNSFSDQIIKFWDDNSRVKFRVNQILLYSSANAEDKSDKNDMSDVSVSQFTDIAIYIDNQSNTDGLSEDNTLSDIYIDNITVETGQKSGNFIVNYKSPLHFGKYESIDNKIDSTIQYKVIHTNDEITENDNLTPTFYTDCSNPISLGFVNKDVIKHYKLTEQSNMVNYNGTILKTTNVDLDKISPKISFDIHIKTNMNEYYMRKMYIDVPLENSQGSISSGYLIALNYYKNNEFCFIKE
jgi:hypothetical protein